MVSKQGGGAQDPSSSFGTGWVVVPFPEMKSLGEYSFARADDKWRLFVGYPGVYKFILLYKLHKLSGSKQHIYYPM
jgi:hypothetical protein